jgi:pyruvate-ferredoxin/flavodoxin oxidoreductase
MTRKTAILDGNEAAAGVAYRLNEVIAIYPITPCVPLGGMVGSMAGRRPQEQLGRGSQGH